jgi:hypothetical protein
MDIVVVVAGVLVILAGLALAVGRPLAARGQQVRIGDEVRGSQPASWWVVLGVAVIAVAILIAFLR